jgi:hypothetical protein
MITLKSTSVTIISLLILGLFSTQAQEQAAETNSLKPGIWALQFGISSNFTLSSFQGTTISAKYQTSTTNAWRAGITLYGNTSSDTRQQAPIQLDSFSRSSSTNGANSSENIVLRVQYLWYINSDGITHFYTGLGPRFGYNHLRSTEQNIYGYGFSSSYIWTNETSTETSNTWSLGASAVAGVEYFPSKMFSLHAEYNSYLIFEQQKTESTSQSTNNSNINYFGPGKTSGNSHQWMLSNGGVSFGLSVYF